MHHISAMTVLHYDICVNKKKNWTVSLNWVLSGQKYKILVSFFKFSECDVVKFSRSPDSKSLNACTLVTLSIQITKSKYPTKFNACQSYLLYLL